MTSFKVFEAKQKTPPNRHVELHSKIRKNTRPPSKPVSTTDSQSMAYVTVKNIESETSYLERDWSLLYSKN